MENSSGLNRLLSEGRVCGWGNAVLFRYIRSFRVQETERKNRGFPLMASKIIGQVSPVELNLKSAFENAVRDIYRAGLNGQASGYRRPIVQRAGAPVESSANVQRKALTDAAKALAQLWKVSPSSSR